jgi:hypothetical protein
MATRFRLLESLWLAFLASLFLINRITLSSAATTAN